MKFEWWHETVYRGYGKRSRFAFLHWLGIRVRVGDWHYVITW